MTDHRLVLSVNALDGHGKTTYLLSAPKPIALFAIDPNTEDRVQQAMEAHEIKASDVQLTTISYPTTVLGGDRNDVQDEAEKAWNEELVPPLVEALKDDAVATIGLDTGSELFELLLMAHHGKTIQILPEMRTKVNYEYKGFLQAMKRSRKNIILLHRLRDHYESRTRETQSGTEEVREKVAGMYEREGFSKTGFHVNAEVCLMYEPSRSETTASQYGQRVHRCLHRPAIVTEQMDDATFWDLENGWWWGEKTYKSGKAVRRCSIPYLATKIYPDTKLSDWR